MSDDRGWIGVDLDGTLAYYDHWRGIHHIGDPIKPMVDRVEKWLDAGKCVKIMTARVYPQPEVEKIKLVIWKWLQKNIEGFERISGITHEKDFNMIELWDDRAIQLIPNTGKRSDGQSN